VHCASLWPLAAAAVAQRSSPFRHHVVRSVRTPTAARVVSVSGKYLQIATGGGNSQTGDRTETAARMGQQQSQPAAMRADMHSDPVVQRSAAAVGAVTIGSYRLIFVPLTVLPAAVAVPPRWASAGCPPANSPWTVRAPRMSTRATSLTRAPSPWPSATASTSRRTARSNSRRNTGTHSTSSSRQAAAGTGSGHWASGVASGEDSETAAALATAEAHSAHGLCCVLIGTQDGLRQLPQCAACEASEW